MKHAKLLSPLANRHMRLLLKKTLDRALACSALFADLMKKTLVTWIRDQEFSHSFCSWVGRQRKLQRNDVIGIELIHDHLDQPFLFCQPGGQFGELTGMKSQLAQKWGDVHHKTFFRQCLHVLWSEVKSSHGNS